MPKRISQSIKDEIIKRYTEGELAKDLAKEFNLYEQSITRMSRKAGNKNVHVVRHHEDQDTIYIEKYNQGMSPPAIGKELKVSEDTVRRVLKKSGIELRPTAWYNMDKDLDESFFKIIDTEEKAYILGLFYADGNVSKEGNTSKIGSIDEDIISKISQILYKKDKYKKDSEDGQKKFSVLYLTRDQIKEDLISHGCIPAKFDSIRFPYNSMSKDLYRHFVRGYFDGDGCISVDTATISYKVAFSSCMQFLQDLQNILKDNNIFFPNAYQRKDKKNNGNLESKKLSEVEKLYHFMYDNSSISMERKKNKFDLFIKNYC